MKRFVVIAAMAWLLTGCGGGTGLPPLGSTTMTLSATPASPVVEGQPVTLSVQLTESGANTPLASNSVEFFDGTDDLGAAIINVNNQASLTAVLPPGAHTLTAVFSGTPEVVPAATGTTSNTVSLTVLAATSLQLQSSSALSFPGQTVTFTATAAPIDAGGTPTGTVTFVVDNVNQTPVALTAGEATFSSSTLPSGTHRISAIYSGDAAFAGSNATPLTQVVSSNTASTTVVQSSADGSTFTATVSGTGTVTFSVDGAVATTANVSSGAATFSPGLSTGAHTIGATYNGDATFAASTSALLVLYGAHTFSTDSGQFDGAALPVGSTFASASQNNPNTTVGIGTWTVPASFELTTGATLTPSGSNAFALNAAGSVSIDGTIEAAGSAGGVGNFTTTSPIPGAGGTAGPGGGAGGVGGATAGTGANGVGAVAGGGGQGGPIFAFSVGSPNTGSGGGGGHLNAGGNGDATGGLAYGANDLPLLLVGGSGGGGGGSGSEVGLAIVGAGGGGGGGAIRLIAATTLSVTGTIDCSGGNGGNGGGVADGGNGSGGSIHLIAATHPSVTGTLNVDGGGDANSGSGSLGAVVLSP